MKTYLKLASYALIGAASIGLYGCRPASVQRNIDMNRESVGSAFSTVPMGSQSGMAIESGDFDNDGDLDLVVGSYAPHSNGLDGALYYYENQGLGNFVLREPVPSSLEDDGSE